MAYSFDRVPQDRHPEATRPVLVTGATGFIGELVARQFIEEGLEVYGTTRTADGSSKLAALGATPVQVDLRDSSLDLNEAMGDCGSVIHVAGKTKFDPDERDSWELVSSNIETTSTIIKSAAPYRRPVTLVSSAVTVGEAQDETADKDTVRTRKVLSFYEKTKLIAENNALKIAKEHDVPLVRVNPASVQGPGRISGTAQMLIGYINGLPTRLPDSAISLVDPRDCANAIVRAHGLGKAGQRYIVSGHIITLPELVRVLDTITGTPGEFEIVGNNKFRAAIEIERLKRAVRIRSKLELYRNLRHGARYDGSEAAIDLGFSYRPIEETLRDAVEWYSSQPGVITRRLENFPTTHHLPD